MAKYNPVQDGTPKARTRQPGFEHRNPAFGPIGKREAFSIQGSGNLDANFLIGGFVQEFSRINPPIASASPLVDQPKRSCAPRSIA